MRFQKFSFGSIRIDGTTYEHDVVIDGGQIRKRKKKPSKKFRDAFGHTPLSVEEEIPWKCRRLVIGTGTGALPVMEEVKQEANRRKIKLVVLPTAKAIEVLKKGLRRVLLPKKMRRTLAWLPFFGNDAVAVWKRAGSPVNPGHAKGLLMIKKGLYQLLTSCEAGVGASQRRTSAPG
jgi:hypothetical protein